jgi:hypothetical protein
MESDKKAEGKPFRKEQRDLGLAFGRSIGTYEGTEVADFDCFSTLLSGYSTEPSPPGYAWKEGMCQSTDREQKALLLVYTQNPFRSGQC